MLVEHYSSDKCCSKCLSRYFAVFCLYLFATLGLSKPRKILRNLESAKKMMWLQVQRNLISEFHNCYFLQQTRNFLEWLWRLHRLDGKMVSHNISHAHELVLEVSDYGFDCWRIMKLKAHTFEHKSCEFLQLRVVLFCCSWWTRNKYYEWDVSIFIFL